MPLRRVWQRKKKIARVLKTGCSYHTLAKNATLIVSENTLKSLSKLAFFSEMSMCLCFQNFQKYALKSALNNICSQRCGLKCCVYCCLEFLKNTCKEISVLESQVHLL